MRRHLMKETLITNKNGPAEFINQYTTDTKSVFTQQSKTAVMSRKQSLDVPVLKGRGRDILSETGGIERSKSQLKYKQAK